MGHGSQVSKVSRSFLEILHKRQNFVVKSIGAFSIGITLEVTAKLAEARLVGLAELTDGLVANLAHALALDVHVLGYLGHRLVLLTNAEEGIDDFRLTAVERAQGKLHSALDGFGMDALVGLRGILIDEH